MNYKTIPIPSRLIINKKTAREIIKSYWWNKKFKKEIIESIDMKNYSKSMEFLNIAFIAKTKHRINLTTNNNE